MLKVKACCLCLLFCVAAVAADLLVYCGAGVRPPMEELAAVYEKENNTKVKFNFGGSAQLLAQIELSKQGDIFIPGEEYYLEIAKKKNLLYGEPAIIAYWLPVILVQKVNPKKLNNLSALSGVGVRLGIGDERTCAIGMATKRIFEKNKLSAEMEKNVVVKTATVSELGNAIKLRTVDAVIIWDSIAALYADCGTVIGIPEAENELSKIPAAVLAVSPDKKEAGKFVLFLGSDEGRRILKKHHYNVPGGRRE